MSARRRRDIQPPGCLTNAVSARGVQTRRSTRRAGCASRSRTPASRAAGGAPTSGSLLSMSRRRTRPRLSPGTPYIGSGRRIGALQHFARVPVLTSRTCQMRACATGSILLTAIASIQQLSAARRPASLVPIPLSASEEGRMARCSTHSFHGVIVLIASTLQPPISPGAESASAPR
ncbi:hypothetical protein FA95DRAFT_410590 [Auriscalpium vulgare]|uniref:Uncharacterized protein n=1 Tax=Auriscalpium vulgare TaxID=40419 RepID=A0ACB8RHA9_9AGAM|nr:hypothetical protein FA95DRAFT_410590 [Auriscalpium vulgare]